MRRRNLTMITLMAALAAALLCTAALADDTPWKVRRPADNTVLPSEFVHRPGAGEEMPGSDDGGQPPAEGSSTAEAPGMSAPEAAPAAKAEFAEPAAKPQATPAPAAPRPDLGRAGALESVDTPTGVTLFLPLSRSASEPRAFSLKDPQRMVFDLMGAWDNVGANVYRLDNPLAEKVVMGEHEDFLRLVVYLTPAAGGKDPSVKISFTPEGMRLELSAQ